MSNTIINIENISEKYLIGKGKSGSLRETLSNTFRKTLGQKEIDTEEFWALRDINFEVKHK